VEDLIAVNAGGTIRVVNQATDPEQTAIVRTLNGDTAASP